MKNILLARWTNSTLNGGYETVFKIKPNSFLNLAINTFPNAPFKL